MSNSDKNRAKREAEIRDKRHDRRKARMADKSLTLVVLDEVDDDEFCGDDCDFCNKDYEE